MSVILLILIIVLFVKVSDANEKINILSRKIDKINTFGQDRTEEKSVSNKEPAIATQKPNYEGTPNNLKEQFNPFEETKQEHVQTKAEKMPQPSTEEIFSYISNKQSQKETTPEKGKDNISTVQFTAAKIFSWVAAFAFILAVIFGLIYAVQNNIISKQMITALAGLIGLILLTAGLLMKDEKTKTAAATLCASGITTFFIATYYSFSLYNMINLPIAFVLMAAISFISFYISAKRDMQFISFLGMVAAFITPLLLSTGHDNYIFFFTYIAFINGAAMAVSLKKGWNNLLITSLVFTLLCQFSWLMKDTCPSRINIFQIVFTLYSIALTAVYIILKNKLPLFIKYVFSIFIIIGTAAVPQFMLIIGFNSPILINLLLLLTVSHALALILYYTEPKIFKIPAYIVSSIFLLSLLIWSNTVFATQASGLLLIFAILSASLVNSLIINIRTGEAFTTITNLIALFVIFLIVINKNFKFESLFFVHNGAIIFNLALTAIAFKFKDRLTPFSKSSFGGYIAASLLFSFLFAAQLNTNKEFIFILINLFAVNAGLLILRFKDTKAYNLPLKIACFGILIILHYICHTKNILFPLTYSLYLLFGTVNLFISLHYFREENKAFPLILTGLLFLGVLPNNNIYYIWAGLIFTNLICLFLGKKHKFPAISLIAAIGTFILFFRPTSTNAIILSSVFTLVFFIYPFICKKDFKENSISQWIANALVSLYAYLAIRDNLPHATTELVKGLITLSFVPLFLFASYNLHKETKEDRYKIPFTIMSVMLVFFITMAINLIFSKQWLTLAFAIEGATFIFLNSKVSVKWFYKFGLCLFALAFIRLTLFMGYCNDINNQPVILNWFLLVYPLCAATMFISAQYFLDKNQRKAKILLNTLGAILLFHLVNIEIANYFGQHGKSLKFNFFGNFAATITYTIAWTLYGAISCIIAFYKKYKLLLNAGVIIMAISIIKLFMFDLWSLGILYRIIGLFAMAGILFGISLIFQKFRDRLKE